MASSFTHALYGLGLSKLLVRNKVITKRFLIVAAFAGMLPDIDVVWLPFVSERLSVWDHRGITHSLFFAVLAAALLPRLAKPGMRVFSKSWQRYFLFFVLVICSHSLLDATTDGNTGVAFFAPFTIERIQLPWLILTEAPLIHEFFNPITMWALLSELLVVAPLFALVKLRERRALLRGREPQLLQLEEA